MRQSSAPAGECWPGHAFAIRPIRLKRPILRPPAAGPRAGPDPRARPSAGLPRHSFQRRRVYFTRKLPPQTAASGCFPDSAARRGHRRFRSACPQAGRAIIREPAPERRRTVAARSEDRASHESPSGYGARSCAPGPPGYSWLSRSPLPRSPVLWRSTPTHSPCSHPSFPKGAALF